MRVATPPAARPRAGRPPPVRAEPAPRPDAPADPPRPPPPQPLPDEARLEALERGARRGRGTETAAAAAARAEAAARAPPPPGPPRWQANKLLPEGWETMTPAQKVTELYQGQRGVLFWLNQAAWYSVIGVAFGWVLFRFVLPAIGVYRLANGLGDAPTAL